MDEATVNELFDLLCAKTRQPGPAHRENMRRWRLSGVERVRFGNGSTAVLKYAVAPFQSEASILQHAARCGLPVPQVITSIERPDLMGMLLEDLGEPVRDANHSDAAAAAAAIHAAETMPGLPVLDTATLAQLPAANLVAVSSLRERGRWTNTEDVYDSLTALDKLVARRADGAELQPYGLCHSEFHPTSLHVGLTGLRVLDFARAFIGPGLLDLASWSGTTTSPDLPGLQQLLAAYFDAGGPADVLADRGGLPAGRWAYGMHRMWVVTWYLQQQTIWINDATLDAQYQQVVRRHLAEALRCLA